MTVYAELFDPWTKQGLSVLKNRKLPKKSVPGRHRIKI